MSNRPLAIGFVGAGKISQVAYLSSFAQTPGCEIVALADPRPELAKQVAARFDISRVYANHDQLLQDPNVDAVVVVMPPEAAGPIAFSCLQAGKHLLTADPMACSTEQAQVLVEAARQRGVVHAVGCTRTHDAGVEYGRECVRQFVESGELGPIINIRVKCYQGNNECDMGGFVETDENCDLTPAETSWDCAPSWVADKDLADYSDFMGAYFDSIDLFRWFSDCQPTVQHACLQGASGGLVTLDCGAHMGFLEFGSCSWDRWDQCIEVTFQHGRIRVTTGPAFLPNQPARVEIQTAGTDGAMLIPHIECSWTFQRMAAAFIDACGNGTSLENCAGNAMADLQMIENIWQAALAPPATSAPQASTPEPTVPATSAVLSAPMPGEPAPAPTAKPEPQAQAEPEPEPQPQQQPSTDIQPAVDIMDALRRRTKESTE